VWIKTLVGVRRAKPVSFSNLHRRARWAERPSNRLFPALLLHQKLVGDEGDEFAIGGFVVLAVDSRMLRILRVFDAFSKTL